MRERGEEVCGGGGQEQCVGVWEKGVYGNYGVSGS